MGVVSRIRCPMRPTLRWEGVEGRCPTHRVGLMQFFVAQQAEFLAGGNHGNFLTVEEKVNKSQTQKLHTNF